MRLTDPWFEASFCYEAKADGSFRHEQVHVSGAQGLFLWCPCGYGNPEYPLDGARPHGLIVPFANPAGAPPPPASFGPLSRDGTHRPRWTMSGTGIHDLTLSPSIDVGTPSCWHGWITSGEVR